MSSLDPFFKPESIIFIGAAHTEIKLGGVVLRNLLRFRGRVYPVNPKCDNMMGLKSYCSVKDVPGPVDLALVLRPAPEVPGILRELAGKTNCVIIMSSGFAEAGEAALQEEVKSIGVELGFRIVGPNCMGIYNPHKRLDTFFLPYDRLKRPKKGNVSIISQSGAILSCLLSGVREANTGISKAIGYGNAVDVVESDLLDYLSSDEETHVVVSYIESVTDGRRFIESAKKLSDKKELIVLKAGKGASGQAAAFSHTGRLAGKYEVFRSVMRQSGIREARDFEDLMDGVKALSFQTPLKGNRVCIITNGGGSGVLASDECMRQGMEVPEIAPARREKLGRMFPNFFGMNNPVDLTAQVRDDDYTLVLNELRDDFDGFVVIALPNVTGISERIVDKLMEAKTAIKKPIVSHVTSGGISTKLISGLEKAGIPVYPTPERAVKGLRVLLKG